MPVVRQRPLNGRRRPRDVATLRAVPGGRPGRRDGALLSVEGLRLRQQYLDMELFLRHHSFGVLLSTKPSTDRRAPARRPRRRDRSGDPSTTSSTALPHDPACAFHAAVSVGVRRDGVRGRGRGDGSGIRPASYATPGPTGGAPVPRRTSRIINPTSPLCVSEAAARTERSSGRPPRRSMVASASSNLAMASRRRPRPARMSDFEVVGPALSARDGRRCDFRPARAGHPALISFCACVRSSGHGRDHEPPGRGPQDARQPAPRSRSSTVARRPGGGRPPGRGRSGLPSRTSRSTSRFLRASASSRPSATAARSATAWPTRT